nr:hypothetical protein [Sporocytophaga sp.]
MSNHDLNVLGRKIAILSFITGSLIFLLYYFTSFWGLFIAGYLFIAAAVIGNSIILIALLISTFKNKEQRKSNLLTSFLMFLNIPVAIFYFWLVTVLSDTMRITFINTTNSPLTSIEITGCESKHINRLAPDESETVWIAIPHPCSIEIRYMMDGKIKNEVVEPYVCKSMGDKRDHRIGDPTNNY